ncbi:single-stranded DNA-binding protein [uncultured Microbacterium sp.]|uniref:single-stranded DNA-binding protein n=1 Tax=uncultured Microbacterium sp. TaxID=191216 RepID=UPI0026394AF6|nr:single-stranded DNA-binding protein [uncultured Microbacterium sp.]
MTATITVHGGLTAQPELRYSSSGIAILGGTIASTDRYLDRQTNEWKDGKKLYLRWSAFKELAENIAASNLDKGAQVVITGKLVTREYQDRDGQSRSSTELEVTDFAVSLKRATAQVTRAASSGASAAGSGAGWGADTTPPVSQPQAGAQQWATTPAAGADYGDDTPFG